MCAGPTFTLILGRINQHYEKALSKKNNNSKAFYLQRELNIEKTSHGNHNIQAQNEKIVEKFRKRMKRLLMKEGSLLSYFDCVDADQDFQPIKYKTGMNSRKQFYNESKSGKKNAQLQPLQKDELGNTGLNLSKLLISRSEFMNRLDQHQFLQQDDANKVSEVLYQGTEYITMQQLEDFALGFQQQAVKLFLLGKADSRLFSFYQKSHNLGADTNNKYADDSESDSSISDANSDARSDNGSSLAIISKPTSIQFPKFASQISSMSCGQAHILALTVHG